VISVNASPKTNRDFLIILLLLTLVKGILFASVVPKWQAPDEPYYFKYTRILAEEKRIPVFSETPAVGHPPLFPIIALAPYVLAKPFGNTAQVFSIRLLSVLFSVLAVWIAMATATVIFPENRLARLLLPTFVAFNPQYSFISSSINSDSLLILLFSLCLYQLTVIIRNSITVDRFALLLLTVLVGMFTKERFLIMVPAVVLVLALEAHKSMSGKLPKLLRHNNVLVAVFIGLYLLLSSGWTQQLGVGVKSFKSLIPYYSTSSPGELFFSRNFPGRIFEGFWGNFGWWQYIPMRLEIYQAIKLLVLASALGLVIWLIKSLIHLLNGPFPKADTDKNPSRELFFILSVFLLTAYLAVYAAASYDATTGGGHGRYALIAMIPVFAFLSLGLENLFPVRLHKQAFTLVFLSLFSLNAVSIFYTIVPWYYQ
jgi:hypothetical protein